MKCVRTLEEWMVITMRAFRYIYNIIVRIVG